MEVPSPRPVDTVLLLSPAELVGGAGGRAMLSRINLVMLRDLLGDRLIHLRPRYAPPRASAVWRGWIDGVDAALIADIVRRIDESGVTRLFVDGSNYGAAVAAVKRARPQVRIVTFFHNVEARFFWGSMRARRSVRSLAVLAANYVAERAAVRHSDDLVTLSERDSRGLRRLYGRGADVVAPMVLDDVAPSPPPTAEPAKTVGERYLLFVGGGFYANVAGIRWFAREVAPRIDVPVCVVGRGMDELASEFAGIGNVVFVGETDDLAPWYAGAMLVVAPIFDGSGMKTKVAEALMFGKHVAGTPEAFSGYGADVVSSNRCCVDADTFVAAIAADLASPPPAWDPAMRALYERDHSPAAARARLARIVAR